MKLMDNHSYNISVNSKRHIIFVLLPLFFLTGLINDTCAQDTAPETKQNAIQLLGKEQSMAEGYAFLLNNFGKEDHNKYVRGVTLYVSARAEFNGLIELMKQKLIKAESFDGSPEFYNTLETAVDKRISFTTYISEQIIDKSKGKKGFPTSIITSGTELVKALTEVGKTIWQEYSTVKDKRRKELLDQLEGLKWKAFHEIGGR